MCAMKVAVAVTTDHSRIAGHAGRARHWLVFDTGEAGEEPAAPARIALPAEMVFHHFTDDRPHPLDGIDALIAASAGEGFLAHMKKRGAEVALTAESDPAAAVAHFLSSRLAPPKPRPIGALVCKTLDLFSKHK